MSYDIVIIGAGPAGLACAGDAAEKGMKTLVLERKKSIGRKICAGGITWNGLMQKLPGYVAEKEFFSQYLYSQLQQAKITSETPIIATVNRELLGQYMAEKALSKGAEIRTSSLVKKIDTNAVTVINTSNSRTETIRYTYLVGADGSSSIVRRYLGIPVSSSGVGINYQIPGEFSKMQWHLDGSLFGNGYGWVFPHTGTVSVGAYAGAKVMKPVILKKNLLKWSHRNGFNLSGYKAQAEFINYDYRGYRFNNIFLAGDAAGLASGLTGEGIYPAIISGEAIAENIVNPQKPLTEFSRLVAMHEKHKRMASITGKSRFIRAVLSEVIVFGLRIGLVKFDKIEMAN